VRLWVRFLEWVMTRVMTRVILDRPGGAPYLSRAYLYGAPRMPDGSHPFDETGEPRPRAIWPDLGILLHHFHQSDSDLELHSHPWRWAVSIILSGAYTEELRRGDRVIVRLRRAGSIAMLRNDFDRIDFHRVDLVAGVPVWTLFVSGPRIPNWHFWNRETGVVLSWRKFIARKRRESGVA